MSRFFLLYASGLALFAYSCKSPGSPEDNVQLIIHHATIVDVRSGLLLRDREIVIQNDSILAILENGQTKHYHADKEVDASSKYIIPGLWDMHVHFGGGDSLVQENKNLLPLYVAHGITAVRDAAADLSPSVLAWRGEIEEGKLLGPTLFTSGPKLEGYKSIWAGDIEVGNKTEIRKALDSLQKMKVDFVKITDNTLSPSLFLEVLAEANSLKLKTSGHVPFALIMEEVAAAGLGSVEHMIYMLKAGSREEKLISADVASGRTTYREALPLLLETFDENVAFESYKKIASYGTVVVPTLNISYTTAYLDQNDHQNDDYLKYIGKGLRKTYDWRVGRASKDDAKSIDTRHKVYEKTKAILPIVHKAGVKIIAGTDAGYLNSFVYPGIGLHQELAIFVEAGLTPLEALQTATVNGPAFLGKSARYGDISPGNFADLVILDENPLLDIRATQHIHAVILKGKVFNRQSIDQLLASVMATTNH